MERCYTGPQEEKPVMDWIPQRYPMLYVDTIVRISEEFVCTRRAVTEGDGISVSGTYLLENMAQSAAVLCGYRSRHRESTAVYLGNIDHAQVLRCPKAGDCIETEVCLEIAIAGMAKVRCKSFVITGENGREPIGDGVFVLAG